MLLFTRRMGFIGYYLGLMCVVSPTTNIRERVLIFMGGEIGLYERTLWAGGYVPGAILVALGACLCRLLRFLGGIHDSIHLPSSNRRTISRPRAKLPEDLVHLFPTRHHRVSDPIEPSSATQSAGPRGTCLGCLHVLSKLVTYSQHTTLSACESSQS